MVYKCSQASRVCVHRFVLLFRLVPIVRRCETNFCIAQVLANTYFNYLFLRVVASLRSDVMQEQGLLINTLGSYVEVLLPRYARMLC